MPPLALIGAAAIVCGCALPAFAQNLAYDGFSSTAGLTLRGTAAVVKTPVDGSVIRLTPAACCSAGSAFTAAAVPLQSASGAFSTFFQFRITSPGGIAPADGIVFVLQTSDTALGRGADAEGYAGIPNSLGVEFDTYRNDWDINNNHVSILTGGAEKESGTQTPYGVAECIAPVDVNGCMANGRLWSVWIDYDGSLLHVALADGSTIRPADLIAYSIYLPDALGSGKAPFVGFTAGTGGGLENHDIVSWRFVNYFYPTPVGVDQKSLGGQTPAR